MSGAESWRHGLEDSRPGPIPGTWPLQRASKTPSPRRHGRRQGRGNNPPQAQNSQPNNRNRAIRRKANLQKLYRTNPKVWTLSGSHLAPPDVKSQCRQFMNTSGEKMHNQPLTPVRHLLRSRSGLDLPKWTYWTTPLRNRKLKQL